MITLWLCVALCAAVSRAHYHCSNAAKLTIVESIPAQVRTSGGGGGSGALRLLSNGATGALDNGQHDV